MMIFLITIVIKLSTVITSSVPRIVELEYMLTLYVLCFIWTTYYNFKGTFRRKSQIKFSKSHKSSNRWLKGVVVLFGMAIVVKDGLEFLATLLVSSTDCTETQLESALSFFHAMFILSQVKYLFRFSKVYIRNCSAGSRTGLMLIIAANLSAWIASIIDETVIALDETSPNDHAEDAAEHNTTTTTAPEHYSSNISDPHALSLASPDSCQCHTSFCSAVHVAEKFLFPFLIEFSLVASSLLLITWSNIGKQPPPCEGVIKPSYKFHRSYRGVGFGGTAVFVTLIVIILLGTTEPSAPVQTYYTETTQLVIYNSFLIWMEGCMLIGCCVGFYLFSRIIRPSESASTLDTALLIICIFGPIAMNLFSMLAVIAGSDNKDVYGWPLSLATPIVDLMQCILQLVFILFGLQREPVTSAHAKETASTLRRGIASQLKRLSDNTSEASSCDGSGAFDNKTYLRSRRNSITSIVSALANNDVQYNTTELQSPTMVRSNVLTPQANTKKAPPAPPQIVITTSQGDDVTDDEGDAQINDVTPKLPDQNGDIAKITENIEVPESLSKQSILKIVSETRVARPDSLRLKLRDVIMFLLISNACLWAFMSLDGTAFNVYFYQSIFYGTSAWTTIVMICRPLNIFFRMHSAGCLFEMWSFA
uniref:Otopetrin-2-like n=1 Tax=Phallusia mammillata TaxID=59560 RepID=A0A6F9DNP0_9ASCI|nr:otopetrin-2-like [Phallusia mammillata]